MLGLPKVFDSFKYCVSFETLRYLCPSLSSLVSYNLTTVHEATNTWFTLAEELSSKICGSCRAP